MSSNFYSDVILLMVPPFREADYLAARLSGSIFKRIEMQ